MPEPFLVECFFLVPIVRDRLLSDGKPHPRSAWRWLDDEMWVRFEAATLAPGLYEGFYKDPDTGERVADRSKKYCIALAPDRFDALREFLAEACIRFHQKCLYLSIGGQVEFVTRPADGPSDP